MAKKVLVIGDTHFPWHNEESLKEVYKQIKKRKPDIVVQIGDLYDMLSYSRFSRSLNIVSPKREITLAREMGEAFWKKVKKLAPKATCYQITGNHDARPMRKILDVAPEFEHIIMDEVERLYSFDGVITILDPREELYIDGNVYIHGYLTGLGKHARFNRANVIHGHTHRGGFTSFFHDGLYIWELDVGYLGDRFSPAMSYPAQKRATHWHLGIGMVQGDWGQFIPFTHINESI